jgi:hypothetical protein
VSLTIALDKTRQLAETAWKTLKIRNSAVLDAKTAAKVDKQNITNDQRINGLLPN